MITRLRFKNFKAWQDSGDIRLAPLTVLFGTNSAGKTSIPQLLLLMKQTAESPDRKRALQLGDARTRVGLGTYHDAVHNNDMARPIEVEIEWDLPFAMSIEDPLSGSEYQGEKIGFHVTVRADSRDQPVVESLSYNLIKGGDTTLDVDLRRKSSGSNFSLSSKIYNLVRQTGRAWPLPEPVRFYGFPDEATAYYQNTAFVSDLALQMEAMLKSIFHVGPLRDYPKRLYLWSGELPDHVGAKGDRAIEAILAAGERTFNFIPKQRTKSLQQIVAERLRDMGLISDFKVHSLGQHRKEYEVLVKTRPKLPEVKLTDVGFGVGQVLPVIVECFYVPPRSVVIFEQPEIHLHPKVQADLADLFIDAIQAREEGELRQCQFIIESHSEHFLRRLQLRIAEEKLSKQDAALYFIDATEDAARIKELDVDDFGNIRNWPDGFFGDEMGDLVARTEAQAKRAKKKAGGK